MSPAAKAARAVCASTLSQYGFCGMVGGELGCKAGRGAPMTWEQCVATDEQLRLAGHWGQACAAIDAAKP